VNRLLSLEAVTETYCAWADSLFRRTHLKKTTLKIARGADAPLSMSSAYAYGAAVGTLLDRVLDRHTCIVEMTRLERRVQRKTAVGVQAEKQNLSDTFAFGHLLQDICDGLTVQTALDAPLPIEIKLRSGNALIRGGGHYVRHAPEHDARLATRIPLANLRIEAELLMFIGQTGMNLAQAHNLELRHFFYVSHLDGYQVKEHKHRRGGTVLFEVFKDYKPHFERYLEWRRKLFPHSNRLFPFVRYEGSRPEGRFMAARLRKACQDSGVPFVSPRSLRNTRVNWLLRMTGDPDLTAEMAQHTKQMLLGVYEQPSLQRAMVEAMRFWPTQDPDSAKTQAVAPGDCTGTPKLTTEIPKDAPKPDCMKASGCLWCENHRDVDSLDYVWALTSFGHLKTIELSKAALPQRDEDMPPAKHAIDRIHEKLRWFERSNDIRRGWVHEAQARVAEGDFHSGLREEISELEGTA
jgi:integrase